jgi:two-component system chemotaxis response regulator CheB
VIRVLVAEDSPTARALLVAILRSDPEIEVVGEASDGLEAVAETNRLRPDLVTMDVHMPRLDGLAATKEIMITAPTPILIVTGSTKAREVAESMDALRVGALDVLVKPPGPDAPGFSAAARNLVSMVKTMAHVKVVRHWRAPGPAAPVASRPERPAQAAAQARVRIVAIATSTGGPPALQSLLSGLPRDFPAPIVVVQHITPGFTAGLAAWLSSVGPLRVMVAEEGEIPVPAIVYLAPDDRHLGLTESGRLQLSTAPQIGGFRPSGTFLFEAVARVFGSSAVAIILTGMGDDGVRGLGAVRKAGGRVIAQDEKTSVIFGMPGAAIAEGLAHIVLPIDAIPSHLMKLI